MKNTKLIYVHDPMCSWCWGFRPVYQQLLALLPESIEVKRVLGGLAADSDLPMPEEMQRSLQQTWHTIQEKIPSTEFNFDFWTHCAPRRSTYPACRGVIAARQQGAEYDEEMTHAIQTAYYLDAKNPSDDSTLIDLAESLGLDADKFEKTLNSIASQQLLADEIEFNRQLEGRGFPRLILMVNNIERQIEVDYIDADAMCNTINEQIECKSSNGI